jgi:hypothetical protein
MGQPDTEAPVVQLTSPPPNSFVRGGDPVAALVTDNLELAYAELYIDYGMHRIFGSPPFEWTIPHSTPSGERLLSVRGYDRACNSGSAVITVFMAAGDEPRCNGDGECAAAEACLPEGICVPAAFTAGALGSACEYAEECVGARCEELDDGRVCTRACGAAVPCPGDFECTGVGLCAPPTSGCLGSVAPRQTAPLGPVLLVALAALAIRRQPR